MHVTQPGGQICYYSMITWNCQKVNASCTQTSQQKLIPTHVLTSFTYVQVNSNLNIPGFFSEKIIVGPQGIQYPRFLAQLTLTHYILRSTSFWTPPTPPICLKMPKCAIFGTFWLFHFGNTPKVGVHREKFNIGKVAQIFFGGSYICWDYVISFSQHFPIKKFSPSPSPTPVFHPLFGI